MFNKDVQFVDKFIYLEEKRSNMDSLQFRFCSTCIYYAIGSCPRSLDIAKLHIPYCFHVNNSTDFQHVVHSIKTASIIKQYAKEKLQCTFSHTCYKEMNVNNWNSTHIHKPALTFSYYW